MTGVVAFLALLFAADDANEELNAFFEAILNNEIDAVTADWSVMENASDQIAAEDSFRELRIAAASNAEFSTYAAGQPTPLAEMPCVLLAIQAGRSLVNVESDHSYAERREAALSWLNGIEARLVDEQADSVAGLAPDEPARELIRRGVADQYWRYVYQRDARLLMRERPDLRPFIDNAILHRQCVSDRSNAGFLRRFVDAYGWPADNSMANYATEYAWLILQHADTATQEAMLPHIREAGGSSSEALRRLARLIDRMRVRNGRLQIYGTQWSCRDGEFGPHDLMDPETVDERRAEVGLGPLADSFSDRPRPDCQP